MLTLSLQIILTEIIVGSEADLGMELNSSWGSSSSGATWKFILQTGMKRWTSGGEKRDWHLALGGRPALYRVLVGRRALNLHLGLMLDHLPVESAKGERAYCQTKSGLSTYQRCWLNSTRKTPCSSFHQLQCDSSEEKWQGREDFQTLTSRTSSPKDQSECFLLKQEAGSVPMQRRCA